MSDKNLMEEEGTREASELGSDRNCVEGRLQRHGAASSSLIDGCWVLMVTGQRGGGRIERDGWMVRYS